MKTSVKLWVGFRMCRVVVFGEFQTFTIYCEKPELFVNDLSSHWYDHEHGPLGIVRNSPPQGMELLQ